MVLQYYLRDPIVAELARIARDIGTAASLHGEYNRVHRETVDQYCLLPTAAAQARLSSSFESREQLKG